MVVPSLPRGHSKSSVPAGEFVTRSAALTITRPTEPPRQQSRPLKSPSRKDDSEWERECRHLPHRPPGVQEHPVCSRVQPIPAAVWAQSSVESVVTPHRIPAAMARASSGTLWTGQPQPSQLKPRRNTTCARQAPVGSLTRHRRPGATPANKALGHDRRSGGAQDWRAQLLCQDRERLHALAQPPLPASLLSRSR